MPTVIDAFGIAPRGPLALARLVDSFSCQPFGHPQLSTRLTSFPVAEAASASPSDVSPSA